jgi:16S rRNA (cytidine1402-2'-O)-methyltransferase
LRAAPAIADSSGTFYAVAPLDSAAVLPGHLYVVATPIGNLGDLSPRARAVLAGVDRIAAEDTRTTGAMLTQFGVHTPLTALHEHNEDALAASLVAQLRDGKSLALVSDAGTPLVSDPGFVLVRAARAANVPVIAIPGPCAAVAALSIAGLPSDAFVFAGFLPPKAAARRERLAELAREPRTVIVYESAHRIAECARDVAEVLGDRPVCLAREITKRFEESATMPAHALQAWIAQDANRERGEFVLVIAGASASAASDAEGDRVLRELLGELPASRAARVAAALTGLPRKQLYARALELGGKDREEA